MVGGQGKLPGGVELCSMVNGQSNDEVGAR